MNRDEIRDLAATYAVGGLDGDDRVRFEALLDAGDPEAVAALREFDDAVTALAAESAEAPPARVKSALMERLAAAEPARSADAAPARPVPARPPARRSWWPTAWAAAMAAGIAAIAVGLWMSARYEERLDRLGRQAVELRAQLDRQQSVLDLLRDPATQVVTLSGLAPAPAARARIIWSAPGGGLLVAAGLPPAPPGQAYQLWAIAGASPPVPAGVFEVDPAGTGSLRVSPLPGVGKVDVFAVTLEPAGGVAAPSGPMYLAGRS